MYASRLSTNTPRRPQAAQAAYLHARVAVTHHKAHGPSAGLSAGSKSYSASVNEFGAALSAFLSSLVARSGYFKSLLHVRLACAPVPARPHLCCAVQAPQPLWQHARLMAVCFLCACQPLRQPTTEQIKEQAAGSTSANMKSGSAVMSAVSGPRPNTSLSLTVAI